MNHLFSGPERWLARWWPSFVVESDPLAGRLVDERYTPIPLKGWKLIPPIQRRLSAQRRTASLSFSVVARLTVIIPVRDREPHLARLLPRLRSKLDEQGIRYRLLVVEQSAGAPFNKGVLLNAGFRAAADGCDYVCLHDVDALPLEANYLCPSEPLRLVTNLVGSRHGAARDPRYFGGAITLRREHFQEANGFSNEYWGWGKEDDDFLFRLWFSGRVCWSDQRGTFEDLPNPAQQQVRFTKLRKPKTLRANRRRRSRFMRGLLDYRADGLDSLTHSHAAAPAGDGYERIIVTV
jgi:N-terminal region of glycosyl transferase group 7/N-terminal domain of galactosyltransferase